MGGLQEVRQVVGEEVGPWEMGGVAGLPAEGLSASMLGEGDGQFLCVSFSTADA